MRKTMLTQSGALGRLRQPAQLRAHLLLLALLVFLPGFMLRAAQPQLQKGSRSIYFGFNGLADMRMDNAYFECQYLFAERKGLSAGFHLGGTKIDLGDNIKPTKTSDFSFDVEYIYYPWVKGPVGIFCGPGVGFVFGRNEYDASTSKALVKQNTNGFGVFGFIGVEWWAWDNVTISFSSLYGFQSLKTTINNDNTGTKTTTTTTAWGNLSNGSTSVSVGYYF